MYPIGTAFSAALKHCCLNTNFGSARLNSLALPNSDLYIKQQVTYEKYKSQEATVDKGL